MLFPPNRNYRENGKYFENTPITPTHKKIVTPRDKQENKVYKELKSIKESHIPRILSFYFDSFFLH